MKIMQMPDALANKIAAGEVVERPASVVKELVENSIDANSTWIKIDILEAGLKQIKVVDDGDGMSEKDCEISFLRHATSKIRNETDLFHVKTLGFRGEALASIAAVSRLSIKTSEGSSAGTSLTMEGGHIKARSKSDARKGTEIVVSDLFFNTPARLKYMKTIHTELGHISDLLNRLALSHPEVRFEVTHNGKSLFRTTGNGDLLQVIANIYGLEVAKKMIPVHDQTLDFSITGYIAKPEVTRASRTYISTVINGRYIKNYPLNQAIIRAYHTLLPIGRMPIVVLSITMDPILVDVNVHPTKLEVRFSKEKELVQLVENLIRNTFRQTTLIPEIEEKRNIPKKSVQAYLDFSNRSDSDIANTNKSWNAEKKDLNRKHQIIMENPAQTKTNNSQPTTIPNETEDDQYIQHNHDQKQLSDPTSIPSHKTGEDRIPPMYPIGQLHGTYIMAQNENGLYMVDQHAAQERVKYEYFRAKLGKTDNTLQELLLPLTFEFSKQEAIFIDQYQEELQKVGLFLEPFGQQTYVIRSYPNWFPTGFEEEVIREMVEQIIHIQTVNIEKIREDAAILMSCKRSIKANHFLNHDDMYRLLDDLRKTTDPFTCPHGRPIIIHFSTYEIEKMFKRVM